MCKVTRNRLGNVKNEHQGSDIKVLCVCSDGLLRSPSIARILCRDFENINPRAVGISEEFALIPLDVVHLSWADLIVCAEDTHMWFVESALDAANIKREVISLGIPDMFDFGDPELEEMIRKKLPLVHNIFNGERNESFKVA